MCGTEMVSVFLKRSVQPAMSRAHQLWTYTGAADKSRISPTDLSEKDLQDEMRHLTCLSQRNTIVMTLARPPLDLKHLPAEVISFVFASDIVFISESKTHYFFIDRLPLLLNVIHLHPKVG
jgi:hypothetical protein